VLNSASSGESGVKRGIRQDAPATLKSKTDASAHIQARDLGRGTSLGTALVSYDVDYVSGAGYGAIPWCAALRADDRSTTDNVGMGSARRPSADYMGEES
jgi:hypothetical protein